MVQFDDAVDHPLQKVAVVGDHQQSALEAFEVALQPIDHLAVDVVGRLVQNQYLGFGSKGTGKGNPTFLSAGKLCNLLLIVPKTQLVEDAFALVFVRLLDDLGIFGSFLVDGNALHHLLQDGGFAVKQRVLGKIGDANTAGAGDDAAVRWVDARHHLEQGGFSGPIDANQSDFFPFADGKRAAVQQLAFAVSFIYFFCTE